MDLERTYQAYKDLGMGKKFEEFPDFSRYKKEQTWYEKVKSRRIGDYFQAYLSKSLHLLSSNVQENGNISEYCSTAYDNT